MGMMILLTMIMKHDFEGCRKFQYKPNNPILKTEIIACKWKGTNKIEIITSPKNPPIVSGDTI